MSRSSEEDIIGRQQQQQQQQQQARRHSFTFDELKSVESRLENLEPEVPDLLCAFYEPHLRSFSVKPGSTDQISVTSTCFALQAVYATGDCSPLFVNVVVTGNNNMADNSVDNNNNNNNNSHYATTRA